MKKVILASLLILSLLLVGCGSSEVADEPETAEEETTEVVEENPVEEEAEEEKEEEVKEEPEVFGPSNYEVYTYEQLARNPDDHMYKLVQLSGKIIQVIESEDFVHYRMAVDDDYDSVVLIEVVPEQIANNRILDNDYIRIYGTSYGLITYDTALGSQMTVPGIVVDEFEFIEH